MTHKGGFVSRVVAIFATRVATFGLALAATFALARLLGPDGRGIYYIVLLTPTLGFAIAQLGLPAAMTFFAGRGRSVASLQRVGLITALGASAFVLAATLLLLPALETNVLRTAPDGPLRLMLVALPIQFALSLTSSLLYGRQDVRNLNLILIAQGVAALLGILVFVGLLNLAVEGAVAAYLISNGLAAVALIVEVRRLGLGATGDGTTGEPIGVREFVSYGLRLYPQNVTSFFSYRADVFLLSLLLGDPVAIGLYSLSVNLAELAFYVPDSVAAVFYPRVAGSPRDEADRSAPIVGRQTILMTVLAIAALIPAAIVAVRVLLPAFVACLPAFFVLMPGILALSLSKILASYLTGIAHPRPVALAAIAALIINLSLNLLFIPRWGIVGAAGASVVSYSAHAAMLLAASSRLSGSRPRAFVVPTRTEADRLIEAARALLRRARVQLG